MRPGPRNLITDVPGLLVGNAQDTRLKSGTTVLLGQDRLTASYSVMGGAPGTRETDLMEPDKSVAQIDALVLSGGSTYGLDAASGVVAGLRDRGRGLPLLHLRIPLVPAAIIFDLLNGGEKDWGENPYPALGRAALENARADFEIGSVGAGTGALTGMQKGGLGSASLVLESGVTVGALIAANPVGSVTTPGERHFWAAPLEIDAEFGGLGPDPRAGLGRTFESRKAGAFAQMANTAIGIVATDAGLTKAQAKRVATVAHDGIARAIVPSHMPNDGDLIFAVSTNGRQMRAPESDIRDIGHAAALCIARAVARAVYHARPAPGDLLPCWADTAP
ncbi:P1 family peptidase [Sedimentitalea sp. JM2-8]|uniref:P1 family peptidase n=1 Tax=Sedimentitalea xiamensis TaxID=3050037 RepID=A0ABT7F8U0_9RHOB|nr:P1 family peptidase [Sedimentitalea xiamensis]MDK3071529.1 P1 family peptidase [Sedimentitalea xiamensis]